VKVSPFHLTFVAQRATHFSMAAIRNRNARGANGAPCSTLAYILEAPQKEGGVQAAFNIQGEGSYIVMVKNPTVPSQYRTRTGATYPSELVSVFGGRRCTSGKPVELLNYIGAELIVIGTKAKSIPEELGKAGEELEEIERVEAKHLDDKNLFENLRLSSKDRPAEPLLEGKRK